MDYPGQRIQIDIKFVPKNCLTKELREKEESYYQCTAIDEYTRQRVLWASKVFQTQIFLNECVTCLTNLHHIYI
jgi:hypothetical protein